MRRSRLEHKLWHYFNQGRRPAAPTGGDGARPDASVEAAIEPDGPDMRQQYQTLFGRRGDFPAAGFKCVEALGRIIIRGPYPPSNAMILMHLQLY